MAIVASILLVGHWVDYYQMIMPAATGDKSAIGVLEVSLTISYAALFIFVVFRSLSKGPLIVKNDPFLEESMNYES